ncbi:hypothetical protein Q4591_07110 [Shewanella sp. 3_MG-2023]|uniref:hypothetical protein n=1 Tax=Shewanella sp. 3_MG-2023 TaxID=3062635 RepID=UPI0026E3235E|nr:hypothetical protein [Shewanella sp. 3_MG-2023]MDO6775119.1 hypothetical protein [Shewanella sp. 3_MG-2023]
MSNQSMEMLKLKVEIWKQVIETQQHFNDLEMKVRNYGILIVSALIGAAGVSLKSGYFLWGISLAFFFLIASALLWLCFYFVDTYWYHPLLLGAVRKGVEIEDELKSEFPNIDLTHRIGKESPSKILFFHKLTKDKKLHSTHKANIFYLSVAALIFLCATASFFAKNTHDADKAVHAKIDLEIATKNAETAEQLELLLAKIHSANKELNQTIYKLRQEQKQFSQLKLEVKNHKQTTEMADQKNSLKQ